MDAIQSGIKGALKEHMLCDFVASHCWEMSKEQLRDIALELICAAHTIIGYKNEALANRFYEEVESSLEGRGFFDD